MRFCRLIGLGLIAFLLSACGGPDQQDATEKAAEPAADAISVSDAELAGNPFLEEWDTPYGVPPFDAIEDSHYMPAIKKAVLDLRTEIDAIVNNPEPPTFENTIVALELSGDMLQKVAATFGNITGTDTNDELRALESQIYPMLTREFDAITMNDDLWQRVKAVYDQRESLSLGEQEARLLELVHRGFVRSGASLPPRERKTTWWTCTLRCDEQPGTAQR